MCSQCCCPLRHERPASCPNLFYYLIHFVVVVGLLAFLLPKPMSDLHDNTLLAIGGLILAGANVVFGVWIMRAMWYTHSAGANSTPYTKLDLESGKTITGVYTNSWNSWTESDMQKKSAFLV